ncbi:hypothetical protein M409DRAFT_22936 [Zasmidium cellare ATCC 36951]|uniref:Uncharacterized protein n=1 Tax=Zasmidium cellare ATCC 36951 TaxID=1080233 RepID=A0A6A6CI33_ZASCE|nr:uncharacterized protein M409DRAFT_22936 [Zasmidium cellare ATCC 36951]KAF2166884.1 hypothetical protein M409DRAFT_22936 [Zasmidium cellare ATCC 36951]
MERPSLSVPTVSLYLPMGAPSQIHASIISATPNETAYALGCTDNATTSGCGYNPPITVTEGESTIIFTNTYEGDQTTMTAEPLTMQCQLVGAHLYDTPMHGATSAVCTGASAIAGLGRVQSTSTLASSEINYVPVTITAGAQKLAAASTMTVDLPTGTSTAGASVITAAARLGLGGAVAMAVLGVV